MRSPRSQECRPKPRPQASQGGRSPSGSTDVACASARSARACARARAPRSGQTTSTETTASPKQTTGRVIPAPSHIDRGRVKPRSRARARAALAVASSQAQRAPDEAADDRRRSAFRPHAHDDEGAE